ncbi:MAG: N-acetylmuramoyl-L-alanine amidase [Planctomycetaceae bacterium]|nr:N-acetylmuramoyl-L-alanine amidase [Planctomycetaceae bacterium]
MNSRFKKTTLDTPQTTPATSKANLWQPENTPRNWKYIVLHHTAASQGSVASIHQMHSQRVDSQGNPWRGIGYHFVIGNGNEMEDGKIEQTFRWIDQIEGAHAGNAKYNNAGIGVCLIGNFDQTKPTKKQLASLKKLVDILKQQYGINTQHVVPHKSVKATHCPGKYFPLHLFSEARFHGRKYRRGKYSLR